MEREKTGDEDWENKTGTVLYNTEREAVINFNNYIFNTCKLINASIHSCTRAVGD